MTRLLLGTLAALALCAGGCRFGDLEDDLERMSTAVVVEGHVIPSSPTATSKPILVALLAQHEDGEKVAGYRILSASGAFQFNALPDAYRLVAFVDLDEDLAQGALEPWGELSVPKCDPGSHLKGLEVKLGAAPLPAGETLLRVVGSAGAVAPGGFHLARGDVAKLDDERFSAANGDLGLWEPLKFLQKNGAGIYFLEPYDPAKIPVLLVHGAAGFPKQLDKIAEAIDRKRFQPWIFHYPSGLRLALVADACARTINELRAIHHFDRMAIVAHSMGGLVSRGVLQRLSRGGGPRVIALVTLATPWRGHEAAKMGIDYAPAVVPSWIDMVPGSEYLRTVSETGAWDETPHTLLFGYEGGSRGFDGNGDGAVALASVLDARIEARAIRVQGFPETHVSVLTSPGALAEVKQALDKAAGK